MWPFPRFAPAPTFIRSTPSKSSRVPKLLKSKSRKPQPSQSLPPSSTHKMAKSLDDMSKTAAYSSNRMEEELEPPPPYTETADGYPMTDGLSSNESEDSWAFLSVFDVVFLIDDSGSMNCAGRWDEAGNAIEAIAPICTKYDADGIDIYFLNTKDHEYFKNVTSVQKVHEVFDEVRPGGWTPTARRIHDILNPYVRNFEKAVRNAWGDPDNTGIKPLILIVLTDGKPDAYPDLEDTIKKLARRLDVVDAPSHQVGITFFQVGDDEAATRALEKLDDDIKGIRHMVDTATFDTYAEKAGEKGTKKLALSAEGILKTILGSVIKMLDRKKLAKRPEGLRLLELIPDHL